MRSNLLIFLILLLAWLFFTPVQAQVWSDQNTWNAAWEKSFEKWVEASWSVDVFSKKNLDSGELNPFYGIRTDCADTVYSMRIIFSYQNKLPFVAIDPTGGRNLISNRMKRWNKISDEGLRVRQFLLFAYDAFSTKSLPADTYPVAISRETVHAGGLMMTTSRNHHSWTIQNILAIGVPHLIFNSSVGATSKPILQQRTSWPNPEWVYEGDFSPAGGAGLRYWRQPQDIRRPAWEVPGYSEEQYQIPLARWTDVVQKKLALASESDSAKLQRLVESACAGAQGRVASVREGIQYLATVGGRCLSYEEYDIYSTPSRDHRVFDDLIALRRVYRDFVQSQRDLQLPEQVRAQMNKIFPAILLPPAIERQNMAPSAVSKDSVCIFEYASGKTLDLAEYKRRSFAGLLSNNPNDSLTARWGDSSSEEPNRCQSWDIWQPDLSKEN